MGLLKGAKRIAQGIGELGKKSMPIMDKAGSKIREKGPGVINKAAGIGVKAINGVKSGVNSIKNGKVSEGARVFTKSVLTDNESYNKKIGKMVTSNKPLIMDEFNSRIKNIGDRGAAAFDMISKDKLDSGGKNPFQLIKKSSDSMVGYKANGKGKMIAGAIMLGAGVPSAGKQYIQNRQGTNMDQQATTSAPRVPAYAQNGGATGDLVFALNNLRHGGMM